MLIEPVDAGDDAVGFVGVGGGREPRQQGVAPGVLAGVGVRRGGGRRGRRGRVGRARGRGESQKAEEDEKRPTRHDGEPKASLLRGQNTIAAGPAGRRGAQPWRALKRFWVLLMM